MTTTDEVPTAPPLDDLGDLIREVYERIYSGDAADDARTMVQAVVPKVREMLRRPECAAESVTDERLASLRAAAQALVAAGFRSRWRWAGHPDRVRLTDRFGELLDVDTSHRHFRYWPDQAESTPRPCPSGGHMHGNRCSADNGAGDDHGTAAYFEGDPDARPEPYIDGYEVYPVLRFMTPDHVMVTSDEIPVFEVCRDATSADDPRVYRTDIVGFRHPAADYLAEADAATVLALVDEVIALRQKAEAAS